MVSKEEKEASWFTNPICLMRSRVQLEEKQLTGVSFFKFAYIFLIIDSSFYLFSWEIYCFLFLLIFTCFRSFSGKVLNRIDNDVENGKLEIKEKSICNNMLITVHNKALLSGIAYCISSCSMILVNKYVLSSYNFKAGISLMLYQVPLII